MWQDQQSFDNTRGPCKNHKDDNDINKTNKKWFAKHKKDNKNHYIQIIIQVLIIYFNFELILKLGWCSG